MNRLTHFSILFLFVFLVPFSVQAQPLWEDTYDFAVQNSTIEGENLYFIIRPNLEADDLKDIIAELQKRNIKVKVHNKNYNDGVLTDIDISIEVPGKMKGRLAESGTAFQPIVFYYETSNGENIGMSTGIPHNINAKGKKAMGKTFAGLVVEKYESGGWQIIGDLKLGLNW